MISPGKWIGNLPIFIHFCMFDLQKIDENAVRCQGYPPSDLPSWEEALWHSAEDLKNGRI
jgi:hypothetical protein